MYRSHSFPFQPQMCIFEVLDLRPRCVCLFVHFEISFHNIVSFLYFLSMSFLKVL